MCINQLESNKAYLNHKITQLLTKFCRPDQQLEVTQQHSTPYAKRQLERKHLDKQLQTTILYRPFPVIQFSICTTAANPCLAKSTTTNKLKICSGLTILQPGILQI